MKRAVVIILLFCSVFSIFGTGTPVIDVAAITTAVQNFTTTVEQYNRQIKQWQSEYEKIKKAAEGISSGDFTAVVTSVASLAGQMSGWTEDLGWTETNEWLKTAQDGSYSLLSLVSNANFMLKNMDNIVTAWKNNMKAISKTGDDAWDVGSGYFSTFSTLGDFLTNFVSQGGNMVIEGASMAEDIIDLFRFSPDVAVEIYREALKKILQEKAGVDDYAGLLAKITSTNDEITKAQAELLEINSEEDSRKYKQKEKQIEQLQKQLADLKELKELYLKTDEKLAEMEAMQEVYDTAKKEEKAEEAKAEQAEAVAASNASLSEATKKVTQAEPKIDENGKMVLEEGAQ